eukprot:7857191-Pyramimonas_sp.AAC.1
MSTPLSPDRGPTGALQGGPRSAPKGPPLDPGERIDIGRHRSADRRRFAAASGHSLLLLLRSWSTVFAHLRS